MLTPGSLLVPTPMLMLTTSRLLLLTMTMHLQLRFLVKWGLADVEDASQHAGPFQLLRAVIGRQIAIPEVYDVMKGVQELMVRAQVRHPLQRPTNICQGGPLLRDRPGTGNFQCTGCTRCARTGRPCLIVRACLR